MPYKDPSAAKTGFQPLPKHSSLCTFTEKREREKFSLFPALLEGEVLEVLVQRGLDLLALLLVGALELLGLLDHALDLLNAEAGVVLDDNLVLAARGAVHGRHVHDAVGVNVERDLELGDTGRGGGDARQVELAQLVVVL